MTDKPTHAPQAFVAYHSATAAQIAVMESQFVRLGNIYPEVEDMPVFERWFRVLEVLPEIRGKHLWDDMTEMLTDIYKNGSGDRIAAAVDYVCLRWRFFEILRINNIGRAHVNDFEIDAACVWREKLCDRVYDTHPAEIKSNDEFVPAQTNSVTMHRWLH